MTFSNITCNEGISFMVRVKNEEAVLQSENECESAIRLHILGIPHTITRDEYSHCAFTGKVQRFAPMMRSRGFEVYHYGVETSQSGANVEINLLTKKEWEELRAISYKKMHPEMPIEDVVEKLKNPASFVGDLGNWDTPLYVEFNTRLKNVLSKTYRSKKTDIICIPFGPAHEAAIKDLDCVAIESGIGYSNAYKTYRIYESYAQMHWYMGKEGKNICNYWFVVPNYYNTIEFPLSISPKKNTIGFLGRIGNTKGCHIIADIAKCFPDVDFILCGQGDPQSYITSASNVYYKPPIHGKDRGWYLGSLTALLCPSNFLEPFCGTNVEAQLCGTPVIAHDFGAFPETIEPFKTGLCCHTLADFCYGIQLALDGKFDREYISKRAVEKYDMYNVANKYEYVFKTILNIYNGTNGWYSPNTDIDILA